MLTVNVPVPPVVATDARSPVVSTPPRSSVPPSAAAPPPIKKTATAKVPPLCAVSVRAAVLGLVVDEEAGGVVERTALGWCGKELESLSAY